MAGADRRFDVAVIGGGPAGAAAALMLRQHAPALSVALLEAGDLGGHRPGEMLPAAALPILAKLGAGDVADAAGVLPAVSVTACWEDPHPAMEHSLFSGRGAGRLLDRARFDRALTDRAGQVGVDLRYDTPVRRIARAGDGWRIETDGPGEGPGQGGLGQGGPGQGTLSARFLIVATGRRWPFLAPLGAVLQPLDPLAVLMRIVPGRVEDDPGLTVAAAAEGWWYTAPLPGGRRVLALITDPATLNRPAPGPDTGARPDADRIWADSLAGTGIIARLLPADGHLPPLTRHAAGPGLLSPAAGPGWAAAGDAAAAFDPLSSQGITRALRSGIFAAYAAADWLAGRTDGVRKLAVLTAGEMDSHMAQRRSVYARCRRWPDAPFWQSRQPAPPSPAALPGPSFALGDHRGDHISSGRSASVPSPPRGEDGRGGGDAIACLG